MTINDRHTSAYWFYAYASWKGIVHKLPSLVTDGTCSILSLSPSPTCSLLSHVITTGKILAAVRLGFRLCQLNIGRYDDGCLTLPCFLSTRSLTFVTDCRVYISSLSQVFCHGRLNSLSEILLHNLFMKTMQLFLVMSGIFPPLDWRYRGVCRYNRKIILK